MRVRNQRHRGRLDQLDDADQMPYRQDERAPQGAGRAVALRGRRLVVQRAAAISSLILLLSAAAPARAQSPEQAYIAARSEAAARLEATKSDALDKRLVEAQRSLEPQLRALVGPP